MKIFGIYVRCVERKKKFFLPPWAYCLGIWKLIDNKKTKRRKRKFLCACIQELILYAKINKNGEGLQWEGMKGSIAFLFHCLLVCLY